MNESNQIGQADLKSYSTIRKAHISLLKAKSHANFLKECLTNSTVPKNFQFKNHINLGLSELAVNANRQIDNVLAKTSTEITILVSNFYDREITKLEKEINNLHTCYKLTQHQQENLSKTLLKHETRLNSKKTNKIIKLNNGNSRCQKNMSSNVIENIPVHVGQAHNATKNKEAVEVISTQPLPYLNMSNRNLDEHEISILSKGLTFCLSKKSVNKL